MKKLLLMLTVLCGTVSAWAAPTDLPEMSTEGNIKWYTIKNTRSTSGSYLYWAGDNVGMKDSNTKTARSLFYFTGTAESCYIHNSMNGKLFANQNSWTTEGVLCSISETPHSSKAGVAIGFSSTYLNEQNSADGYTTWGADDEGSIFVIEAVTPDEVKEIANADKTSFLEILDAAPSVFNTAAIKAEVEAIEITGIESAQALYAAMDKMYLDRFFTFQTLATDYHRNGVYIGVYDSNPVYASGVTGVSFNEMWSFKPAYTGYDKFVLYNDIYDKYIGTPGQNANTDLLSNTGSIYTIEIIDDANNTVEFKCNGRTLHASNHNDDKLLNWDGDEAASRWKITEVNLESFIQEEIDNCGNNYAETPELGQYSKEAYDLLVASKTTANTPSKVKQAIATFKASINRPVYFITSMFDGGYSAGSAILYNGTSWQWATANIFNKQMWMTIPNYNQENVPVVDVYDPDGVSYEICDYLTGTLMRGKKVQIVNVAGWDGAMNLQYSTNTNDAVQHAQNGGSLVGWNPAAVMEGGTKDCSASAWHVEYIGTSYELGQLSEEYFNAAAELAALSIPNFEYGTGVNNYSDANKPALDAAIANRADVLRKLSTADEIAAAKAQLEAAIAGIEINLPENGKFYRLRCTGSGMKYMQFTQNTDANRFDMISGGDGKTVNATFCYINGGLVAYANPLYINHDGNVASYKMTPTTVTFSEATNVLGQYFINVGGRYLFGDGNKSDSGEGTPDNRAGYRWWLEEVTTLPVTITAAGYATFFAPVAVEIPEGVEAYYTEEVGENAVVLTAIEGGVIPANTGVILKGEANTYNFNITADAEAVAGNKLAGTCASTYVSEDAYVLSKVDGVVGMYKALKNQEEGASWLNNGFKAYLPATAGGAARFLVFDFGTETGIDELKGENGNVKVEIYDLSGRRVQNAQKGLYIVNGKKVVR